MKRKHIRKFLKILAWTLGTSVLLLFGAAIAAQTAGVQTMLARKAMKVFGDRINAEVRFESINISPMMGVSAKGVAIIDHDAWDNGDGRAPQDTLFSASHISATFSPRMLLSKNGISIRQVQVTDALFAMVTEPDPDSPKGKRGNIKRIFAVRKKDNKKGGLNLKIGKVGIEGMEFRMVSYMPDKKEKPHRPDAINWKDLDIKDIHLKGRDMKIAGGIVMGRVDELSFIEKSGFAGRQISGKAEVGGGRTVIDGLHIDDGISDIRMSRFMMEYDSSRSFSKFLQQVSISADIEPSLIDIQSVAFFAGSLKKMDFRADVQGRYQGPVADFSLDGLSFSNTGDRMSVTVDGRIKGIPDISNMKLDVILSNGSFTLDELSDFIRGFAPSSSLRIPVDAGRLSGVRAEVHGILNSLRANVSAASALGRIKTGLQISGVMDRNMPVSIEGNLNAEQFNLGAAIPVKALGEASFSALAHASFGDGHMEFGIDTLDISSITAMGHVFHGIGAKGKYGAEGFEARLESADSALTVKLDASMVKASEAYRLRASVDRANLGAIGLLGGRETIVGAEIDASIDGRRDEDLKGRLLLSGIRLGDGKETHRTGDIRIDIESEKDKENVRIGSELISGAFTGNGGIGNFIKEFAGIAIKSELPSLFPGEKSKWSGNDCSLNLLVNDRENLLSMFVPGLYIADSTSLRMNINRSGHAHANLRSERIALRDKYLKGLRVNLDNRDHNLNLVLNSDELSIAPFSTRANRVMMLSHEDNFGVSLSYDNDTEMRNKGEIFLRGSFSRDSGDILSTLISLLPSNVYINSEAWTINPANATLRDGRISIDRLDITNEGQNITAEGAWSKAEGDSLKVSLEQFSIANLKPFIGDSFSPEGYASGTCTVKPSAEGGIPVLLADLSVADCAISGRPAGNLRLSSNWDREQESFVIMIRNFLQDRNTLAANVLFRPKDRNINGRIGLDGFDLGYAAPVLKSVFREFGGQLSGSIRLSGDPRMPEIGSNGLRIDNGKMQVDFTGVTYNVDGPIHIDNSGAWFDTDRISDMTGAGGTIDGGIAWNRFKDMNFDTRIRFSDMEVLNIGPSDRQSFYGDVSASGSLNITGPMKSLRLDVNASTANEGSFHVPMSSSSMAGNSDILTFRTPQEKRRSDRYELMMGRMEAEKKSGSDLGISLKINVNELTQAFVELDRSSGNVLSGRGRGNLEIDVRPSRDIFNINGKYELSDGNYHLDVMGISQKDFAIQDGSSIRFAGDIMDSDLDINAVYRTKAVVGTLIADTTSTARRNVECGISISDKIRNPQIGFSINVPDLDPTTQAMVENALNTEDKVQKQFLSLLLSSSFLPDENSGIVNNTNMFNTTISEIMAGQLNNILQKLDIPVDLGLDFQSGTGGKSIYDVAISTQLFNNRVIVNGTIGNRMYSNSATANEVVGDLDIEIKIDKKGALRFNLFSHSADQYTSYLDASQRNGLGLTYQREFDSLKEFLGDLFLPSSKKEEQSSAREGQVGRKLIVIEQQYPKR